MKIMVPYYREINYIQLYTQDELFLYKMITIMLAIYDLNCYEVPRGYQV